MTNKASDQFFQAKHVRAATRKWEQHPNYGGFRQSTKYDVIINGKRYPPKPIAAIAYHLAGGPLMSPSDFAGAREGKWHKQLQLAGGEIHTKNHKPRSSKKTSKSAINGLNTTTRHAGELETDLQAIVDDPTIGPTTVVKEILARLGQGKFRQALLKKWGNRCSVTRIGQPEVLRASHIKRWADCIKTPHQRHDRENGLVLTATLDCLFEAGLISFNDVGKILINKQLFSRKARIDLEINESMSLQIKPSEKQKGYLQEHRVRHGFSIPPKTV